jgi:hypothetical protein
MQKRTRAIAVTASMTVAGIALGATIASAANSSSTKPPALQSTGSRYVFACVNPGGGIDYLEFRAPLPHQCWFAGESLWYWDAVPLAGGGSTPTPTFSPTPTVSPTPSPTPADVPVLAGIETTALAYTSGATAAAVPITATLTVTDSDGSMVTGATVSITSGFSTTADTLSFTPPSGSGITGTFNNTTGVMTLTGSATAANYQAALLAVKFASTTTTSGSRTVSFQVSDADTETSNTVTRTITVTAG